MFNGAGGSCAKFREPLCRPPSAWGHSTERAIRFRNIPLVESLVYSSIHYRQVPLDVDSTILGGWYIDSLLARVQPIRVGYY